MLWFVLAMLTALAVGVRDVSVKTFKELGALDVAAVELCWSLPPLLIGYLLVPWPELDQTFWWAFLVSLPLNIVPSIL